LNESIGEWLDSNQGEQAKTSEYKEKKSELEKLVKHVLNRSEETEKRPLLIERLKRMIQTAQTFHTQATTTTTTDEEEEEEKEEEDKTRSSSLERFTATELTNLSTLFTDVSNWLETSIKKQSKLTLYQDPILKVKDLEKKFKELETLVEKLSKKKLPKIPKKQKQKTKKNSTTKKEDHKKDEL
jgi:hypoxia up-regulated 1